MSESKGGSPSQSYVGYACGAMRPGGLGEEGFSASGWRVEDPITGAALNEDIKRSRQPNRRVWPALIMAIVKILEYVPKGSRVEIRLKDHAMVLSVNKRFIKADGKLAAGREFWQKIIDLAEEKKITMTATRVEKTDRVIALLYDKTSAKANEGWTELRPKAA